MSLVICLLVLAFVLVDDAYAYLDPGSISYALQVIGAVLVGCLVTGKVWWGQLKSFFTRKKNDK